MLLSESIIHIAKIGWRFKERIEMLPSIMALLASILALILVLFTPIMPLMVVIMPVKVVFNRRWHD